MNRVTETQIHDPVLGEIVRRLVDDCQPERIYLFGSRHGGTRGPETPAQGAPQDRNGYDGVNMGQGQTDTDSAIEAMRIAGFQKMTPAQKLALAGALTRNIRQLALAGIRLRHPGIDDREAMLRLAAMSIDRAIMVRAFGWDPEHVAS